MKERSVDPASSFPSHTIHDEVITVPLACSPWGAKLDPQVLLASRVLNSSRKAGGISK